MATDVWKVMANGRRVGRYCHKGHDKAVTGNEHGQCMECLFIYRQKVRHLRRRKVNRYKVRVGCSRCGYKKSAAALDFHHRNPKTKAFSIGPRVTSGTSWNLLVAEIRKCMVLCRNCHAELHEEVKLSE